MQNNQRMKHKLENVLTRMLTVSGVPAVRIKEDADWIVVHC